MSEGWIVVMPCGALLGRLVYTNCSCRITKRWRTKLRATIAAVADIQERGMSSSYRGNWEQVVRDAGYRVWRHGSPASLEQVSAECAVSG